MLTTQDDNLAALARSLRDHGATRSDHERHSSSGSFLLSTYPHLGFNFRLTDIQGALGVAQMDRLADILAARRAAAARYDELLEDLEWLRTPTVPSECIHGYQAYVTLFVPEEPEPSNIDRLHARRNALMASLEREGIATRQGTHAAALQSYYVEKYAIRRAGLSERMGCRPAEPRASSLSATDCQRAGDGGGRASPRLRWMTHCPQR